MKSWRKYLIEVFVIMFSILGAFWLEQWNEEGIEEKDTLTLLESLRDNLLEDREELKGIEKGSIDWIKRLNLDLERLDSFDITDSLRIANLVGIIFWITELENQDITFQEMINTGKFYKIKEPELKREIASYYKKFSLDILNVNEFNNVAWETGINPLTKDKIILRYEIGKNNLTEIDSKWLNDSTDERFKWFKFQFLTHIRLAEYQLSIVEELLKINNKLEASIHSYLQKK